MDFRRGTKYGFGIPAPVDIEGFLLVRRAPRAAMTGCVYDAKWRDSRRQQAKKVLGPAWIEPYGDGWRRRSGDAPVGYLTPNQAMDSMRAAISAREERLRLEGQPGPPSFRELAEAWHALGPTMSDWKPATTRGYRSVLKCHLLPAFGDRVATEITDADVRLWWRSLHDPGRDGGPLANRNANSILAVLRSILNWAVEEKHVVRNPALGFKKHREPIGDKAPFYTPEEVLALVRTAERLHRETVADPERRERAFASRYDGTIFLTAAFTGLRRGELVSLRWRNVDFTRRAIYAIDNVSAGVEARVKDHDGRIVPMATEVAQRLAKLRPDDALEDDYVFPAPFGRRLDPDALSSRFREARKASGLKPLRFHDLRHTFGSLAVDGGASIIQVKSWMGHSDVKTTMRYLHSASREADARLLDEAFAYDAAEQMA